MEEIRIKPTEIHLEISQGRTLPLRFQIKTENDEIIKEKVDEMYITFKYSPKSQEKVLFQKRLDNNTIIFTENDYYYRFTIDPDDTENLDITTYYFDIDIKRKEKRDTIGYGTLTITKKVTYAKDRGIS